MKKFFLFIFCTLLVTQVFADDFNSRCKKIIHSIDPNVECVDEWETMDVDSLCVIDSTEIDEVESDEYSDNGYAKELNEIKSMLDELESMDNTPVVATRKAILHAIRGYIYSITIYGRNDDVDYLKKRIEEYKLSIKDMELLALQKNKDYKGIVSFGKYGNVFKHDMLHTLVFNYLVKETSSAGEIVPVLLDMTSVYKKQGNQRAVNLLAEEISFWKSIDSLPKDNDSRILYFKDKIANSHNSPFVHLYQSAIKHLTRPHITVRWENEPHWNDNEKIFCANKDYKFYVDYENISEADIVIRKAHRKNHAEDLVLINTDKGGKIVRRLHLSLGNDSTNQKRKLRGLHVLGTDTISLSLPAGEYVMSIESDIKNYRREYPKITVTSMEIIVTKEGDNRYRCLVLDAISGMPMPDIKVKVLTGVFVNPDKYKWEDKVLFEGMTDIHGEIMYYHEGDSYFRVVAEKDNNDLARSHSIYEYKPVINDDEDNEESAFDGTLKIFTDRSVYRPGQDIHVSGIAYKETGLSSRKVVANQRLKIILFPLNDITDSICKDVVTNEMGSFDCVFHLSSSAKVGEYVIYSLDKEWAFLRVEEYKRPTWDVSLNARDKDKTYSIGDTLYVDGLAKSFSGIPISNALVEFRTYSTCIPFNFSMIINNGNDMEYAPNSILLSNTQVDNAGYVRTDNHGHFSLPLPLTSKFGMTSVNNANECYRYLVRTKVTDAAGETHVADFSYSVSASELDLFVEGDTIIDLSNESSFKFVAYNPDKKRLNVTGSFSLKVGDNVYREGKFDTDTEMRISDLFEDKSLLPMGDYHFALKCNDSKGKEIARVRTLHVFDSDSVSASSRKAMFDTDFFYSTSDSLSMTHSARVFFAPKYDDTYCVQSLMGHDSLLCRSAKTYSSNLYAFDIKYDTCMHEGATFSIFYVKDGELREYPHYFPLSQPDEELSFSWKVFRDRLIPGNKEKWTLIIKDRNGRERSGVEFMATMYDASLDMVWPNHWSFDSDYPRLCPDMNMETNAFHLDRCEIWDGKDADVKELAYSILLPEIKGWNWKSGSLNHNMYAVAMPYIAEENVEKPSAIVALHRKIQDGFCFESLPMVKDGFGTAIVGGNLNEGIDEYDDFHDSVYLRTNFAETAFFYPHLVTDKNGEVEISFTLPESLTKWKFLGFAHDKEMNNGVITAEAVAQKTFMVQPQMPRFIRVGDEAMIPVRIINQGDKSIKGRVQMRILNARTEEAIKSLTQTQTFSCGADTTIVVTFPITATSSADDYICEVVAEGNVKGEEIKGAKGLNSKVKGSKDSSLFTLHSSFSDGERNLLPVLPSRVKLTESVPFYIDNASEKTIDLSKVYNGNSTTAEEKTMSIEYTANPVWTVVEALRQIDTPESPSAPSLAASVYANSMLLALDTKFSVYTQKPVVNRDTVNAKLTKAMKELRNLQCKDGGFRWFSGFDRSSYYITLLVAEQLVKVPVATFCGDKSENSKDSSFYILHSSLNYLDSIQVERYEFNRANKIKTVPSESDFHYLYVCSMTPERKVSSKAKALRNEMLSYIETHSQELSIYGLSASSNILRAFGRKSSADKFLNVVRHYLVKDEGLGKHFESNRAQYSWYDYRIPTQVAAMEAFYAANTKDDNLNDMTLWLLRQKQVQSWDNPANTVNVCDLLLKMNDSAISSALLTHDSSLPRMSLNGKQLTEKSFVEDNVKKDSLYFAEEIGYMNKQVSASLAENAKTLKIQRNNGSEVQETSNSSISWGAVTVTFTEESNKLNSYTTGEVRISRRIMVEDNSSTLPKWRDLSEGETLKVGQKVRVRHTLHTDRDMDYVCVKTLHPACFEPVDKLSGYQWKGGEGCYQSIHDSYIEMFFQTYHEGTSTLDIDYYVTRPGTYNMGITTAECTYAPMYGGHSTGMKVVVEK